jgi:hypothetical protein
VLVEELKQSEIICYQFFYSVMYPYFFCDLQAIGLGATILWLVASIVIFGVIGCRVSSVNLESMINDCFSRYKHSF